MKRLVIIAIAAFSLLGVSECYAQNNIKNYKDKYKARKELRKMDKDFNDEKASKRAREQAKDMKKEGWKVAPGALPLEMQLDRSFMLQNQTEDDLLTPMYVSGDATSTAESYDAGKMQALELARLNLAANIETNITEIVENNRNNKQLKAEDAASVIGTLKKSKSYVSKKLGQTTPVVEVYRKLDNGNVQVRVMTYYSMETAREIAKDAIREQLEQEGKNLGTNLDELIGE